MEVNTDDTIVAISTPPGRGGVGMVRLSGPEARAIAEPLLLLRHPLAAGRVRFAELLDEVSGAVLDEAIVTYFSAPRSYTGEDVVEIAVHGAPVLLENIVRRCVARGARLAEPGEFTERAFLSGRLDLTQAEAVADLIEATTLAQARTAARQMSGSLSRQIGPVKQDLIRLIAALEAGVDFAEDDLEVMPTKEIASAVTRITAPLTALEESFAYGRVLRSGFRLAIVGRPNAGKSSLFNKLIRRDRAIVTAQPGTTRDPVSDRLEFAGIPVELTDTAGLRASEDEAEGHGIRKSREAMAEAEIVLLVLAADQELHEEDKAVIASQASTEQHGRRLIVAINKIDLTKIDLAGGAEAYEALALHRQLQDCFKGDTGVLQDTILPVSALDGTGIEALRAAIATGLKMTLPETDTALVTNLRQHQAVTDVLKALKEAEQAIRERLPHEMLLLDLHEALGSLDLLTGTTLTDEILNLIFSSFCIGK